MMIDPSRVVNLPPTSFGTLSVSCEGNGIIAPTTVSPTLMVGIHRFTGWTTAAAHR
jgi:hypothetical protein